MTGAYYLSRLTAKPTFCICKNKDADQLRGIREADQCLCFRNTDITIPLLPKSEFSSLLPSSVTVKLGLCQTRSENLKTAFLMAWIICASILIIFLFFVPNFVLVNLRKCTKFLLVMTLQCVCACVCVCW